MPRRFYAELVFGLAAVVLTTACSTFNADAETLSGRRLIVKFETAIDNPADPVFVRSLVSMTGVSLAYVRPMSGAAHVYAVETKEDDVVLEDIVRHVEEHPYVRSVEPDRLMHPQSP